MSIDAREKLLEVAARVYAETGYRGTTTRRIAQEADLNEVTLFRHFGSKDALLREAIERADRQSRELLDPNAADPIAELHRWALAVFQRFYRQKNLIRQVLGDIVERPEIAPSICDETTTAEFDQLILYLRQLEERGVVHIGDPDAPRGERRDAGARPPESCTLARPGAEHAGPGRMRSSLCRSPVARRRGTHSCWYP